MRELTHLSLFSGIGGLDLAAEAAGFVTVGQCEWADYPTKILERHWPGLPRWRDIRTLTKESFHEKTGLWTVDIVSGGFPCQPFSCAGKQRGKEDDRYLWPEMLRVISELRPAWVLGENVPGIVNLALDQVLSDLEAQGYKARALMVPACGVDAPHKRNRIAILAHTDVERFRRTEENAQEMAGKRADNERGISWNDSGQRRQDEPGASGMADGLRTAVHEADPDPDGNGLPGRMPEPVLETFTECSSRERERESRTGLRRPAEKPCGSHSPWEAWPDEPGVGRVADGVPNRVDRIRCLGNAVVPQQFYPFFAAIAEIERSKET